MSSRPEGSALMEKLVSLCKRRGFVYPASEIYGGLNGFWDYGPLGAAQKPLVTDGGGHGGVSAHRTRRHARHCSVDLSIIQNPAWVASGHVGGFSDPMVDCRATKNRYRLDHDGLPPTRVRMFTPATHSWRASPADRQENEGRAMAALQTSFEVVALEDLTVEDYAMIGPRHQRARHPDRAQAIQPDVPLWVRPVDRRTWPTCAPRSRHLPELQERARHHARQGPLRHRADREGFRNEVTSGTTSSEAASSIDRDGGSATSMS